MCGITGFLTSKTMPTEQMASIVLRMARTLAHRGPDQEGTWTDAGAGVALGFRRLAIVDLTIEGHQPMQSASRRYVITFNGEIYNFQDLRVSLQARGHTFRGHSDTEVLLSAFDEWGIEDSVKRLNGMFAFAVWDAQDRTLTLARDPVGIKPLYVYHEPGLFAWGSELKSLTMGPSFDKTLDPSSIALYLRYLYVPAPQTVYKKATKLLPGSFVKLRADCRDMPLPTAYWSLEKAFEAGEADRIRSKEECVDQLDAVLTDSVKRQMVSDVPLGALLSGGIDSSTVVALMQEITDRPVKTYTIGFDQKEYDESGHARAVAEYLGTDHTSVTLTAGDALNVVPMLPQMFDEPHADPSQIPTYLVSKLARSDVTVALTGDGGDELFAGYNRYLSGHRVISRLARLPRLPRQVARVGLNALAPDTWGTLYRAGLSIVPGSQPHRLAGEKIRKIRDLLAYDTPTAMYRCLMSAWQNPESLVQGQYIAIDPPSDILGRTRNSASELIDRMMLADQATYLPGDLLAKVDRASMAVGLEARVPILDHRVVELSWHLPLAAKIQGGVTKWALRQVLYKRVPRQLIERPKSGFTVPIDDWLRGPLREWAEDLLSPSQLDRDGFLRSDPIRREWQAVQKGLRAATSIWAILVFMAWRERWI